MRRSLKAAARTLRQAEMSRAKKLSSSFTGRLQNLLSLHCLEGPGLTLQTTRTCFPGASWDQTRKMWRITKRTFFFDSRAYFLNETLSMGVKEVYRQEGGWEMVGEQTQTQQYRATKASSCKTFQKEI